MQEHKISMLGTGLIGMFYTMSLNGGRGRDRVQIVYSRSEERAKEFAAEWGIPQWTTDLAEAITSDEIDTVVIGLPNHIHEECVNLAADAGKAILCTKPLGRTATEAKRMLDKVESAGVFGGYLEDLCYTPKTFEGDRLGRERRVGRGYLGMFARNAPGATQRLVLGPGAGGRRRNRRSGLPLYRDCPQLHWQGHTTGGGDVLGRYARPSHRRRGQRHSAHPLREWGNRSVRSELDLPRRNGLARRGSRYRRHDLVKSLSAHRL